MLCQGLNHGLCPYDNRALVGNPTQQGLGFRLEGLGLPNRVKCSYSYFFLILGPAVVIELATKTVTVVIQSRTTHTDTKHKNQEKRINNTRTTVGQPWY